MTMITVYRQKFLCLLVGIVLLTAAAHYAWTQQQALAEQVDDEAQSLKQLTLMQQVKTSQLQSKKNAQDDVAHFLNQWRPYVVKREEALTLLSALETAAHSLALETSKKSSSIKTTRGFSVLELTICVTGDYHAVLQWLGQAEEMVPLMQIKQVILTGQASLVSAELSFKLPLIQ